MATKRVSSSSKDCLYSFLLLYLGAYSLIHFHSVPLRPYHINSTTSRSVSNQTTESHPLGRRRAAPGHPRFTATLQRIQNYHRSGGALPVDATCHSTKTRHFETTVARRWIHGHLSQRQRFLLFADGCTSVIETNVWQSVVS